MLVNDERRELSAASRALAWEASPHGVTVNLVAPSLTSEKAATLPAAVTAPIVDSTPRR